MADDKEELTLTSERFKRILALRADLGDRLAQIVLDVRTDHIKADNQDVLVALFLVCKGVVDQFSVTFETGEGPDGSGTTPGGLLN